MSDKKLFYYKDACFRIFPEISSIDAISLAEFIAAIKGYYSGYFFWAVNDNFIIINEDTDVVYGDILNQLLILIHWIFGKGYLITGYFYCRVNDFIECIALNGQSKLIIHYVLIDDVDIDHFIRDNIQAAGNEIITDAENKLLQHTTNVQHEEQPSVISVETKIYSSQKKRFSICKMCTLIGVITVTSFIISMNMFQLSL